MPYGQDQLSAYLRRIGLEEPVEGDRATLYRLQRAHRLAIAFENLDIPLGRGISLEPERLFAKLVADRRGGYCFEQNALFLGMIEAIGFAARPLLARVWLATVETPPRTHTLNLVRLDGEDLICDVGFGGSFVPPMRLADGEQVATPDGARHRLGQDDEHGWMLERDGGEGWGRQYSFTLERVWPADLEAANHFTATRLETRFTTLRIASATTEDGYVSLVDRTLTTSRMGRSEAREIDSAEDYRRVLAEVFRLALETDEVEALALF
jgi:N-hydroxyarylamine O-acetyltransferase